MSETTMTRSLRVTSVKYNKPKGEIAIGYQNWNETTHGWDNLILKSSEPPAPEFIESLGALSECVCAASSMPHEWAKEMTVTGYTRKVQESGIAVVIAVKRDIQGNDQPMSWKTPTAYIPVAEDADLNVPTQRLKELLDAQIESAAAYLNGTRGQMVMELPEGESGDDGDASGADPEYCGGDSLPSSDDPDHGKPAKTKGKRGRPPLTAKAKGKKAYQDGKELSHCPYHMNEERDAHHSWQEGWLEARDLAEREKKAAEPDPDDFDAGSGGAE